MSNVVLIMGESGTGKSTSIRTLNPSETFIINVIDKALPFKGFKSSYKNMSPDGLEGNVRVCDDAVLLAGKTIPFVIANRPDIKNIVIDDFQYIMGNEFMRRAKERGFDKFTEIAMHAWLVINTCMKASSNINFFILTHSELGDNGRAKCKTIGKMLDEKITIEGLFTIVLQSFVQDGKYRFLTQYDAQSIAKSPMGMFEDKYIPNDLQYVVDKINAYFNDEDIPQ